MGAHAFPPGAAWRGLVGDIGGTNARFALCALAAEGPAVLDPLSLRAADYETPEGAALDYLDRVGRPAGLAAAAIACAGPVVEGRVRFTNLPWTASEAGLSERLGLRVRLINDLAALAWATPALRPEHLQGLGGGVGGGGGDTGATLAVMGVGTGFNASAFLRDGGHAAVLSGEGGHASFAPCDALETEVGRRIAGRFGRASVERVLSGPGLHNIYAAVCEIAGAACGCADPAEVSASARGGDPEARRAVDVFCAIMGSVAGDLALTFGARGGMFIAGGVAPGLLPELQASAFRRRFEDKGRFRAYLEAIPTAVITYPHAALLGAALAMSAPGVAGAPTGASP